MNVLVITKGSRNGSPVITYGKDTSDESYLPLPPGEYPDAAIIPVFGLHGLMFQSVYDENENGVVDEAESVPWAGVEDPPFTFPSTIPEVAGLEAALESLAQQNPRQAYTHTQSTVSGTWIINHNLGFKPDVALFNDADVEFEANVMHTSLNQTVVNMNVPYSGYARLT